MKDITSVGSWMNDLVVEIDADAPLVEALALMRKRYIQSLIVKASPKNPDLGIVTSSDICDKVIARGVNPAELKVGDVMNSPLITVTPKTTVQDCARIMTDHHIHHLPVVNPDGKVIGLISASDFLVVAEGIASNFGDRTLS